MWSLIKRGTEHARVSRVEHYQIANVYDRGLEYWNMVGVCVRGWVGLSSAI